ncbi:MAG: TetR/AcrR family transcriptional regulator [Pseudomonadota bacterium]
MADISQTTVKSRQGNPKVSRDDWLNAARDALISEGVGEVKILSLSTKLGVARSSFYWYFQSRSDLLSALLDGWEARNTKSIQDKCSLPARTIGQAVCHFFECFIDPNLFDQGLDFAVREWARRDARVRAKIDAADSARIAALIALFHRFGFSQQDADARARILYFMQLGYHALDVTEPMTLRMSRLDAYLKGFTGQVADPETVGAFQRLALQLGGE